MVTPSAPASATIFTARIGSGWVPPRAFRNVATWSIFTPSLIFLLRALLIMVSLIYILTFILPIALLISRRLLARFKKVSFFDYVFS